MKVVGYVRISRDEDKESYSSIISQKKLIDDFAEKNGWAVARYYEDDNFSGYTFDRPAMNQLKLDLSNGLIDIIIAKDLSRIGRHNAYTLLFIEEIKKQNKRLILPFEARGYDSASDDNDMLGIFTWFNEMYIKDISRKTCSNIKSKQKEGKFIVKEYFGYRKSSKDKHMLVIDLFAAEIVKRIFNMYIHGNGYRRIAEQLNENCLPTPSQLIKKYSEAEGNSYNGNVSELWTHTQVQRIIKNDIYIGTLRLAKTKKTAIKGNSIKSKVEDQFVFEDNHEAIISREDFYLAQNIVNKRSKFNIRSSRCHNNIFSGILFCKTCGSYMIAYNRNKMEKLYICGSYHKHGPKYCTRHHIAEKALVGIYREMILQIIGKKSEFLMQIHMEKILNKQYNNVLLDNLTVELEKAKKELKTVLNQMVNTLTEEQEPEFRSILEEGFRELKKDKSIKLKGLLLQLNDIKAQQSHQQEELKKTGLIIMNDMLLKDAPDKKEVELTLERINVDEQGNLWVDLTFDAEELISE